MLKIYNTLTQQKEIFDLDKQKTINIYVCGPTVYDYFHIGNARVFVFFDVVVRYLKSLGFKVKYIKNITDIDDKIIKRAQENNESTNSLTKRFIKCFHEDERGLYVLPPDAEPKATAYISQMIEMIQILLDKGFAYLAANGDVYYKISAFKNYGDLAKQNLDQLRSGIRVKVTNEKQDPLDFVLWKVAKPDEPSWDSPWGKGRPGWHSECAAMAAHYFNGQVDIHGGGKDLQFPHHQNELAQAEVLFAKPFVKYWMHVGYVQIDKQKMSKSLGNFFLVRDLLQKYDAEVLRYFLLASHYRGPLEFSKESLDSAHAALNRVYLALRGLDLTSKDLHLSELEEFTSKVNQFHEAMQDDFNIPKALAILFDIIRDINKLRSEGNVEKATLLASLIQKLAEPLVLFQKDPAEFLQTETSISTREVEQLIAKRNEMRKIKNWQVADDIRKQLLALDIELEDTSKGTIWRKKKL